MSAVERPDILLTHAYFLGEDPTERRVMRPYVPLGILSLSAYLEREGFSTGVFDSTFETPDAFRTLCERIRPPIVGISVNMMTRGNAVRMILTARKSGARVIVGGPEPALYAEQFLEAGADVVVIGEGEETLLALMKSFSSGQPELGSIDGIAYSAAGRVERTRARAHLANISTLPLPAREKVDLKRYLSAWKSHHGYSSLSVSTMRGCPYTCAWCSHAVYGESYRRREPAAVARELQMLLQAYAPDMFWFADDVFTISKKWILQFQEELESLGVKIAYECITRADRMDEEVVIALHSTGCKRVWIGTESGSQRILDSMSRGVTVEEVAEATRLARRAGIEVGYFLMLGYDGETRDDVELTVRHLRNTKPDLVLTTVAYPIKGTRFYELMRGRMNVPDLPFDQWNDRMIEVTGRPSRRFYWFANRRLVNEAIAVRNGGRLSVLLPALVKAKVAQLFMSFLS
jgi:radical SAM superfamily enzyme YgiQ (UPF0313 family)